jgi:hypothetical protein
MRMTSLINGILQDTLALLLGDFSLAVFHNTFRVFLYNSKYSIPKYMYMIDIRMLNNLFRLIMSRILDEYYL